MPLTPQQLASARLLDFGRYMRRHVKPAWIPNWHHEVLADALMQVESGKIDRLIVEMPPQHGKSELCSRLFPAWYLGRHPDRKVISASYNQGKADEFGGQVRNLMREPEFAEIFPSVTLSKDSKSKSKFTVRDARNRGAQGEYKAVGIAGQGGTGNGANIVIIDDPDKGPQTSESTASTKEIREWFSLVVGGRLAPGGAIIIIMTRWKRDDLAGWVQKEFGDQNWRVISMPCIAEEDEEWSLPGNKIVRRSAGDRLWHHYSEADIEKKRAIAGQRGWSAQYQQKPAPKEGAIVKEAWFRNRYKYTPEVIEHLRRTAKRVWQSWDTAQKEAASNDESCCTTWAEFPHGSYLLDVWTGRVGMPELRRRAAGLYLRFRPHGVLIEDKSSGTSLIQELRAGVDNPESDGKIFVPVIPIEPHGNKEERLDRCTPALEAGVVWLPESAPWLDEYLREMLEFPHGALDNRVDSTSQYLGRVHAASTITPEMVRSAQQNIVDAMRSRSDPARVRDRDQWGPDTGGWGSEKNW